MTINARRDIFVGRDQEIAELTAALDDAMAGNGHVVMIYGEPGIGKSRVAQEFARLAQTHGATPLWARCHETRGSPSYWPWIQVIRACLDTYGPDKVRAASGPAIRAIAQAVPELETELSGLEPLPPLESPEADRFRFFDSISTLLNNLSWTQPQVIVVDDLHAADRPSLLLLEFLAHRLAASRTLLVGTYRDAEVAGRHPIRGALAELTRAGRLRRLSLPRLGAEAVGQMTEDLLGFAPSTDVIETLLSRSEGNPLFLTEMLRLLGDATRDLPGDVDLQTRLPVQMPDTVRDVIRVRLNRLSDKCNDILATAAVLGRDLDVEALAAASDGVSREDLLGAVDEALDAHVLEAVQQRPGHYRFTHILIRDTIEGELSQVKKARLHAYVGGALERIHADDVQRHAAKLAQHFSEAQPILGPAKAVRYSAMAGDSAMTSFAWEEAVVYFQRALMAGRDASVFDELEGQLSRADILARLGTARKAIAPRHQQQEAVDNLSEAFDQYVAMGDRSKALTVALGPFPQIPVVTGVEKILLRALEIAPRESPEAGRLLSQLVAVHGLQEPDMERGQQALQQGLIIARKSRDKSLEMSLLANAAQWLDVANLRFSSGTEKAQEALSLAPATDDLHLQVLARSAAICCLMCGMGDLKEALSHAARLLPLADRLHERHWQAIAHAHYSAVSSLLGDWYTARHHSDLALALEPLSAQILGPRVILEYEKGNVSEAEAKLSALLEAMRLVQPGANNETSIPSIVLPLVTRITGEVSHVASAEAAARAVLASPRSIPLHTLAARAGLGLIAAQRNDTSSAQEQYEAISEFQGTMVTWVSCSNDRVLGILASAIGRPDRAASHFEDALERTRAAGYAPEMARTCYDYASFLVQSDPLPRDPNYRQKISGLVGEGLAVASRLDMPALKADLASLRLNRFGRDAVAYPANLTPRETEVLCLVAAGLSNREIAQKLVITYNTAVNHVKSILNKTGCTNRAGLAAFAVRNGLDRTIVD